VMISGMSALRWPGAVVLRMKIEGREPAAVRAAA
jgi:hypothetical protein